MFSPFVFTDLFARVTKSQRTTSCFYHSQRKVETVGPQSNHALCEGSLHLLHEMRPASRTRSRDFKQPPTAPSHLHKSAFLHVRRTVFLLFQGTTHQTGASAGGRRPIHPHKFFRSCVPFSTCPCKCSSKYVSPAPFSLSFQRKGKLVRSSIFLIPAFFCASNKMLYMNSPILLFNSTIQRLAQRTPV